MVVAQQHYSVLLCICIAAVHTLFALSLDLYCCTNPRAAGHTKDDYLQDLATHTCIRESTLLRHAPLLAFWVNLQQQLWPTQ